MSTRTDAEDALGEMEAELKKLREASRSLAVRSRAFTAAIGKRSDEGLIAKLRRQLGLG